VRECRLMVEHFINWLLLNSVYCSFSFRFLLFPSYIKFPTVVEEVLYYCPITFYIFDISCSLLCRLCVILVHLAVAYVSVYRCICVGLLVCVCVHAFYFIFLVSIVCNSPALSAAILINWWTSQLVVLYVTTLYRKMQCKSSLNCNGIIVK